MVQIFIAHSSKDEWLTKPVADNLRLIGVEPYLAELVDPTPFPLPPKISSAIDTSAAMFVFWSSNVAERKGTRDIVNWEISAAYHKRKPIYVFAEEGVDVPMMVSKITVYATYNPDIQQTLNSMVNKVQQLASAFKQAEDKAKAAFTFVAFLLGLLFVGALLIGEGS